MAREPETPWGGADLPLETEDEYRDRRGPQNRELGEPVIDLGNSGPDLLTIHEKPNASARKTAPGSRLAPLWALALFGLLAWEIGANLWQHQIAPPKDADWRTAVTQLKTLRKQGEPVLIAPFWVEPLARAHLKGILDLDMATLSDVDRFSRVFELSIRGAQHPWLRQLQPKTTWSHGPVTLSLFVKPAVHVLYDFHRQLPRAKVTVAPPFQACPRAGKRFVCGGGPYWVGHHLAEVAHRPYRAIYAAPLPQKRLRIDFSKVPLGKTIVGYTGIDDFENRKKAKGRVRLQIFVGDKAVGEINHENAWPWRRFEIDTRAFAKTPARVRFEITSAQPAHRTFCFYAEARR